MSRLTGLNQNVSSHSERRRGRGWSSFVLDLPSSKLDLPQHDTHHNAHVRYYERRGWSSAKLDQSSTLLDLPSSRLDLPPIIIPVYYSMIIVYYYT